MNALANEHPVKQFITIDDDDATLFMCKVIIQRTFKDMLVTTYSNPELAVEYFQTEFNQQSVETVVLLDINMPQLSGWEVLDYFSMLSSNIRKNIKVIMLSSSIDPSDKQRALAHPLIIDYLEKPLTLATLDQAMNKMKAELVA